MYGPVCGCVFYVYIGVCVLVVCGPVFSLCVCVCVCVCENVNVNTAV